MFQVMFDLKRCRRLGLSGNVKGDASDSDLFRSERGGSKVFTNFDLGIKKSVKKNPFSSHFLKADPKNVVEPYVEIQHLSKTKPGTDSRLKT